MYDDTCCSFCRQELWSWCCIKMCSKPGLLYLGALEKEEEKRKKEQQQQKGAESRALREGKRVEGGTREGGGEVGGGRGVTKPPGRTFSR